MGFLDDLAKLVEDAAIRRLAERRARSRGLAEDALQDTFYAVARTRNPEVIENLRAYFLRVLRNEIANQRALRRVVPLENPEDALYQGQPGTAMSGPAPAGPVDETVCSSLQMQSLLKRLADERERLRAAIPARSDDPGRYRAMIYHAAVQIIRDARNGEASEADSNAALRAAYPAYFDQPGASPNLCHQRFRRAREDVRAVLRAIIDPGELT